MDWATFITDNSGIWMFSSNCQLGSVIVYKLTGFDGRMHFVTSSAH